MHEDRMTVDALGAMVSWSGASGLVAALEGAGDEVERKPAPAAEGDEMSQLGRQSRRRSALLTVAALPPLVALLAASLALASGTAIEAAPSAKAVVFKLKEKHDSGVSGSATVTATGTGVRVVLQLKGPQRGSSLAHIHTGPCRREPTFTNPRIWVTLSNVERRRSVTPVDDTTLAKLRARPFSINVHDPNSLGVIACGDIPLAPRP